MIFFVESVLTRSRSGLLFHIHDRLRGRWQARYHSQVPGRLRAGAQGELYRLARGAVDQLPHHAYPVPDCEFTPPKIESSYHGLTYIL